MFSKSGVITARLNVPRTGFVPGQIAKVSAYVNNASSKAIDKTRYLQTLVSLRYAEFSNSQAGC